jgi:pyruvate dehydrogenase E2 component (dihydrolipoamide acetyltransferase)
VAFQINVPRLGWSMDEGTFLEWRKRDGDLIKPGDILFVLESDKAAEEIEAIDAGILRIPPSGPNPGDTVKVGQVLAYLVAEGEATPTGVQDQTQATCKDASAPSLSPALQPRAGREQPSISPRARRLARESGLDWRRLQGSGRNGRIRERDVRSATVEKPQGRLIPHTNIRRTIAARMVAGVTCAAPVTLTTRADATNLVKLRNQLKTTAGIVPTYTDLVLKLAAAALRQHPLLLAQWRDDGLFLPQRIDIAIAVDTDAGLLVPVVREVDQLTLAQIALRTRELIAQAQAGNLTAEQMSNASFTISNLGGHGVDAFTPIILLPQSAVLGIGRIVREPAVVDDQIVPRDMVTLSLTFDHRVVDGAPAARFLATLRNLLEQASINSE